MSYFGTSAGDGAIKARWWVGLIDEVVRRKVIDRAAGLVLGAITSIGIVSDYIVNALGSNGVLGGIPTVIVIGLLVLTWFRIKAAARSSVWEAVTTSTASLLVAGALVLVLDQQRTLFRLLSRWSVYAGWSSTLSPLRRLVQRGMDEPGL